MDLTTSLVATAGDPGSGKSTDAVAAGAGSFFFFAPPGGLRVDLSVLGISLEDRIAEVRYLEQVTESLAWVKDQGFAGVGVDDASVLCTASHDRMKSHYGLLERAAPDAALWPNGSLRPQHVYDAAKNQFYRVKGYDRELWSSFGDMFRTFLQTARNLGLHVVLTGHVEQPHTDKFGHYRRGGLAVAWKKLTPDLIYLFDTVQLAAPWPDTQPWDRRVKCDELDGSYALKDRHDVLPANGGPLNTGELLRAYGHQIRYPVGLEWIDDFAERGAEKILRGEEEKEVIQRGAAWLKGQNVAFPHARWAIRDAVHRGRFRLHRASRWDTLT